MLGLLAFSLALWPSPLHAGKAERIKFLAVEFVAYRVEPEADELAIFWQDAAGKPLNTFAKLQEQAAARSRKLKFAINGGIFSSETAPLGLHVENSKVLRPLNVGGSDGRQFNFYLKPNGVFFVASNQAGILETGEYAKRQVNPVLACQSGPLLLLEGKIHPAFRQGSTNLHWRTGVGVTRDQQVVFAISNERLCFYDFARFFKEKLNCDNALYLDGDICAIYLPELGYRGEDRIQSFAAMFAVLDKPPAKAKDK
jgi:uncharacterized protein YigE (DUF2233 family)